MLLVFERAYYKMCKQNMTLVVAQEGSFIVSDNPCIFALEEDEFNPFPGSYGVMLPISPRFCLAIMSDIVPTRKEVDIGIVRKINEQQIGNATRFLYAREKEHMKYI